MKKSFKLLCAIISLALISSVFFACAEGELNYSGKTLASGNVGEAYSQSVANATGSDDIIYTVKSGTLPTGLTLSESGVISGTPTAVANAVEIVIEATANGYKAAEATFTLTILEAGVTDYFFEAALTELDNLSGGGLSGNPTGKAMIVKGNSAANAMSEVNGVKAYIGGCLHKTNICITFKFTASKAAEADLSISIGGDLAQTKEWGPDVLEIKANGTALSYPKFNLYRKDSNTLVTFSLKSLGKTQLVAGENTVTVTVLANDYYNGGTGGPALDGLQVVTGAELTWSPRTDNLE